MDVTAILIFVALCALDLMADALFFHHFGNYMHYWPGSGFWNWIKYWSHRL